MNDLFSLNGRVALITGAAGHLGSAMAEALAGAGAHVLLNGRSRDKLNALAKQLTQKGYSASVECFDVRSEKAVSTCLRRVEKKFKRLDVLVNNASAGRTGTIESMTPKDFRSMYEVAVVAAFQLTRQATKLLRAGAKKSGGTASVVNIASMYGMVSPDGRIYGKSGSNSPPSYGPAKAGLIQFTRYAATHLAEQRIRVNAISPGPFPRPEVKKHATFYRTLCGKVPMGRVGRPDELQGAVLFLASDASSFVTGVNLPVDGGWTAW